MIFGILIGFFIILFIIIGRSMFCIKKNRRKQIKKTTSKVKILLYNGIHETINNGAVPLQVTALLTLKNEKSFSLSPVSILVFMLIYPVGTYWYLKKNVKLLEDVDYENIRKKHKAVFANLRYYRKNRMGLGYTLIVHYRRLIFSVIIVFMN